MVYVSFIGLYDFCFHSFFSYRLKLENWCLFALPNTLLINLFHNNFCLPFCHFDCAEICFRYCGAYFPKMQTKCDLLASKQRFMLSALTWIPCDFQMSYDASVYYHFHLKFSFRFFLFKLFSALFNRFKWICCFVECAIQSFLAYRH